MGLLWIRGCVLMNRGALLAMSALGCLVACAEGTQLTGGSGAGAGSGASTPDGGGGESSGCNDGFKRCGGSCTSTDTDAENCGDCGVACDPGDVCDEGACASPCPGMLTRCGGECVDTLTSVLHCGGCNAPCDEGEVCNGPDLCGLDCEVGLTDCGTGVCVDTTVDAAHCGACNDPCDIDQACEGSVCVAACTPGSFVVDIPFTSTVGWSATNCCAQPNYRVADADGSVLSATFLDAIPTGAVFAGATILTGVEHECGGTSMTFQLNGTPIGSWNDGQGPDCDCLNAAVATATFMTTSGPYTAGGSNTISIVHSGTCDCCEAISTVPGTPAGTAFRVTVNYACP